MYVVSIPDLVASIASQETPVIAQVSRVQGQRPSEEQLLHAAAELVSGEYLPAGARALLSTPMADKVRLPQYPVAVVAEGGGKKRLTAVITDPKRDRRPVKADGRRFGAVRHALDRVTRDFRDGVMHSIGMSRQAR